MDYLICWRFFLPVKVLSPPYKENSYVPMFGETEFDPIRQFHSIDIKEQLDALGRAVDAGKLAECCHHERVSLLAYSHLGMGILSGKYFSPDGGPVDARLNLFEVLTLSLSQRQQHRHPGNPLLLSSPLLPSSFLSPSRRPSQSVARPRKPSQTLSSSGGDFPPPASSLVVFNSSKDFRKDAMMEDWVKKFEKLAGSQVFCFNSCNWGLREVFRRGVQIQPVQYSCKKCYQKKYGLHPVSLAIENS
ncbi:hypothetical protein LOK49_LG02G00262 [Camellia lanceoleosa]|uniref:Uncharacterized protein n=1 Tax=Camellia lanceoleosa TaxID=1840588 RepID=A0ACC0IMK8_9ERIC|nr:hypothetical protein LOK49_LG02G00262 [Camellia lanceoleosa]